MALPFAAPQQLKCSPAQCALKMLHLSALLIDSSASIQQSTLDISLVVSSLLCPVSRAHNKRFMGKRNQPQLAGCFIFKASMNQW